jgi:hypothetical protein
VSAVHVTPGSYARARVRELDRALVQALNRARALDYQLPRTRIRELTAALADDLRQIRELAAEFEPSLDGRAATLLHGLVDRLEVVLVDDLDHLTRARTLARRLAEDLDRFRALADEFVEARLKADTHRAVPSPLEAATPLVGSSAPARMAAGLVAQAVRALPAAHRARWREEFDAELEELAMAAASRWSQVGHASRVAGRVWLLRRALLTRTPAADRV